LQPGEGFAAERYFGAGDGTAEQTGIGVREHLKMCLTDDIAESHEGAVVTAKGFGVFAAGDGTGTGEEDEGTGNAVAPQGCIGDGCEKAGQQWGDGEESGRDVDSVTLYDVFEDSGGLRFGGTDIRMAEDGLYVLMVKSGFAVKRLVDIVLQREKGVDESGYGGGGQGVTHGDVDLRNSFRNGVEEGNEKGLVRDNDGSTQSGIAIEGFFSSPTGEQGVHVLGLPDGRGYADDFDVRPAFGNGRSVTGIVGDVPSKAGTYEAVDNFFLGGGEVVKADENKVVVTNGLRSQLISTVSDQPAGHAFVGTAFGVEVLMKPVVKFVKDLPKGSELAFVSPFGSGLEGGPETTYGFDLAGGEVTIIAFDLPEVGDVTEEHTGVDEVFVDVIEVAEKHLSPINEIVESLLTAATFDIEVVKGKEEPEAVSSLSSGKVEDEIVKALHGGGEEGTAAQGGKVLTEVQPGTRGGENEKGAGRVAEVVLELPVTVTGDVLEGGFHDGGEVPAGDQSSSLSLRGARIRA
jgi:hypothetical protein